MYVFRFFSSIDDYKILNIVPCAMQQVRVFPHFKVNGISFSALISVSRTSKTMLNSSGESGHPCLVPDFRGNVFNFSPLRIMFAVGLSYIAFIMLRYIHYIPRNKRNPDRKRRSETLTVCR